LSYSPIKTRNGNFAIAFYTPTKHKIIIFATLPYQQSGGSTPALQNINHRKEKAPPCGGAFSACQSFFFVFLLK
jgi:hypothetical protein